MNSNEHEMDRAERLRIAKKLEAATIVDPVDAEPTEQSYKIPERVKGSTRTPSPKSGFKRRRSLSR